MDDIDRAQEREQIDRDMAIREAAHDIPPGKQGDCEQCGERSLRLIGGVCARCRDKYHLP